MEARTTLNETSVSRTFAAAVFLIVGIGLIAMGASVAQSPAAIAAHAIASGQGHPVPGTILRQDYYRGPR